MFKNHLIHLFKYNDWATRESANSIKKLETKDENLTELLTHIVSAQNIWINRILKREIFVDPWKKHNTHECISQSTSVTVEWINLLESYNDKDFDTRIEYINTKGEKFVNSVRDIVVHIINHSTYHRAQIAQRVKAAGGKPATSDYIVYQRSFQK